MKKIFMFILCLVLTMACFTAGVSSEEPLHHTLSISKSGSNYTASAAADEGILYLVNKKNDVVMEIARSEINNSYAEASLYMPDLTEGGSLEAFLWTENLIPLAEKEIFTPVAPLFTESFENFNTVGSPSGWTRYDWEAPSNKSGFGQSGTYASLGDYSAYVEARGSGRAAFLKQFAADDVLPFDAYSYEVTFDVRKTEDYNNTAAVWFILSKDSQAVKVVDGTPIGDDAVSAEGWTEVTAVIPGSKFWDVDFNAITVAIGTIAETVVDPAGAVYFDNLSITVNESLSDHFEYCDIAADQYAAWYTIGDTVVYKPVKELPEGIVSVEGIVYDFDNEIVYSAVIPRATFVSGGFAYTPAETGYYEAEFYGVRSDGSKSIIVNAYVDNDGDDVGCYALTRRSFAVVKSAAKNMEDRYNKLLFVSNFYEDELKKADLIGFSGIKGVFRWGDTVTEKGFHTASGVFDWSETDHRFAMADKYDFNTLIANVGSTPLWAGPQNISADEYNSVGRYLRSLYAPVDNAYTTEGIGAFVERYHEKLDGLEFWNEPYYGSDKTAFWYDTEENFVNMNKAAFNASKSKAPGLTYISAGYFGNTNGSLYLDDLFQYDGFADSFDMISFHGRYNICADYRKVLEENGKGNVPVMNSEGYVYGYFSNNEPKDWKANNLYFVVNYLNQIKEELAYISFFEINELTSDEQRVARGGHSFGLFRSYPYSEPRQGAVVAYNLFDTFYNGMQYKAEYSYNNQKAVCMGDDNHSTVYIWNATGENFALCEEYVGLIGSESVFIDFEGKAVTDYDALSGDKVYFIINADNTGFTALEPLEGSALNNDFVSPFYTCVKADGSSSDHTAMVTGLMTGEPLFNLNTFEVADHAVFNENMEKSGEDVPDSKFAVSVNADGLYLAAFVADTTQSDNGSDYDELLNSDSLRFAFDCAGNYNADERNEYHVGLVNHTPALYKYHAADTDEVMSGASESGSVLNSNWVDIDRTADGIWYKVFIPSYEMYPGTSYVRATGAMRFSLEVHDYSGTENIGTAAFGGGLTGDADVYSFGRLNFYSGTFVIDGVKHADANILTVSVSRNDRLVYLMQYDDLPENYSISIPVDEKGEYHIIVSDDLKNRIEQTIVVS